MKGSCQIYQVSNIATFFSFSMQFEMDWTHTEAVLSKLTKPKLVQFLPVAEANMRAQISTSFAEVKELNNHLEKLEADIVKLKMVTQD